MFRSVLKQSSSILRPEYRLYSSDYASKFAAAQADLKKLKEEPDNDIKLKIYGLFKQVSSWISLIYDLQVLIVYRSCLFQATSGDVSGSQPSKINFIQRAKYDSWATFKGLNTEQAQQQYINLVNGLLAEEAGSGWDLYIWIQ